MTEFALDISRIVSRLTLGAPTGIDRVELAYARYCRELATTKRVGFVLTTSAGAGLLPRSLADRLVATAVRRWSSSSGAQLDDTYKRLCAILSSPITDRLQRAINIQRPSGGIEETHIAAMRSLADLSALVGSMVSPPKANPHGAPGWYIHVSHLNLDRPRRLNWLKVSGLRSMFLLHDLIPITHPEYCRPEAFAQHWRRMETIAHQADVVIFNSKSTQNIWHSHLEQNGLPRPAGAVVPLGIDDTFLAGPNGPRIHSQIPYFVVVGNIERRKNLAFLLHVWKQWTQEGRRSRARLVVVGHRVWGSESIACLLDRSPALAPSIVEVMELTDYGLAALIRGAQALLAPSLIEGFGLPIAEALALGVPVIASDIAAHREVGGEFAEYINPVDGRGWIAALEEYVQPSSPRRTDLQARMQSYTATSWAKHMHEVETILSSR